MIGIFDSGVGGLTVLKAIARHLPSEKYFYIGDTARLPYGNKSPETIARYAQEIMQILANAGCEIIVIACNSASSAYTADNFQGLKVCNVIGPGANTALSSTANKKIGVIGTRATIQSGAYTKTLHRMDAQVEVYSQICPLFVPLAEEAWVDDPLTNLVCYRYLQPLVGAGIDTLILGCTHYPLLKNAIQKAVGQQINLVDSGEAVAQILLEKLRAGEIKSDKLAQPDIKIGLTDENQQSVVWAQSILEPIKVAEFKKITI